jgi:hypothetical protein
LEPRSKLFRHKVRNMARLQALDDEVVVIPWVGLAQNAGSPVVVPDTVPMHAPARRRVSQVPSALRAGAHPICRERRAEKDALERAEEVDLDAPVVRRLPRSRELHSIALLGHAIFRGPRGRSGRSQRI